MKTIAFVAALALAPGLGLGLGTSAQAATNLVANGSFEAGPGGLGSFSGWQTAFGDAATFVDSSGQTGPHPGQASDGLWSAYVGSTASSGGASLSQSLGTVAGQAYLLTFDLANDNAGSAAANGLLVTVGGTTAFSFSNLGVQDYAHLQYAFTASAGITLLTFAGYNDTGYLQLDKVSVTAVPEPAGAALLLAGLIGLGALNGLGLRRQAR